MKCKVGDLVNIVSGYAFKSKDYTEEGIPVIKIKNIVPPSIDYKDTNKISVSNLGKYEKWVLSYNDILISLTGSNVNQIASAVGKVGRVKTKEKLLLNQRVGKFENISPDELDIDYFYYWISRFDIQYKLASSATGSANQANISPKQIKDLEIELPSIEIQRKVSNILKSLDSKIELNNQMIDILEEIASTLFKRWFVDFEFPDENGNPYKSSGGKMIDSELGEIPDGWEIKRLSEIANYKNGLAMQKFRPLENEDSLPVLKIKELNQGYTDRNSDRCSIDINEDVKIYDGDIIFSWSGTLIVDIWTGGNAGLNQHLFKVTSEKYPKWFYYLWTKFYLNKFIAIAKDKATTMGHIKRQHLNESIVCIPKDFEPLNQTLEGIINKVENLGKSNRDLEQTRDLLLPKLLSGEIEV
ncbi:restriction endonuclease subunit S [Vagococcus fluvialis]|uniref:restriction endonuclease subunit S n=1 Tax=Vagococcus fluvialis TaxID=2738 RepID=UPI003B225D28